MASNYEQIRADNQRAYGTAIGRIGHILLADRYDDRTHFIFELLQNAEDALARRRHWVGKRGIRFRLGKEVLRVSHFGKPFDEADVRGVCGIAESTKGITAIGRFGIGFKSVYAFTERPEIHSGDEDFAIENFVWPVRAPSVDRDPEETIILIPLKSSSARDRDEIAQALERVGGASLLFLRELDEIEWEVEGGATGIYLRSRPKEFAAGARRISVVGQQVGTPDIEEDWLIFSQPVATTDQLTIGNVEVAFAVQKARQGRGDSIRRVPRSPLVAYFPTVLETHLGFLIQGPYRTTPSRDNVPRNDEWNQHCIEATAKVLVDAVRSLREQEFLDLGTLGCLPLEREKFSEGSMFAPLFEATKQLLTTEPVLPRFGGGYAVATRSKLSRTLELRELVSAEQLSELFDARHPLEWLSGEISADRTPELREFLMQELDVGEVTPDTFISRLSEPFLEHQADSWILRLYEFLSEQPALHYRVSAMPIVRLEDGRHVCPRLAGQPLAFLPSAVRTEFPTVRASVCASEPARSFLRAMGLTEPNPIDDVVRNVLPKYFSPPVTVTDADYEADIRRILGAFDTDSKHQRERLLSSLRTASFVMTVEPGDMSEYVSKPGDTYIATDRLKELFAEVPDVQLVDDRYPCLRGDDVRELLEACGAVRYLRPVSDHSLTWDEQRELRQQAGHPATSGMNDRIVDWSLEGLASLLGTLPKLTPDQQRRRAELLWDELNHLEERRGKGVYAGEYSWTHYGSYRVPIDAKFVRMLNTSAWIPGPDGGLQTPAEVLFATLGWRANPFIESKLPFKPPIIAQLAKEAGIEPDVLDLLRKLGVTSAADLSARLGLANESSQDSEQVADSNHDDTGTSDSEDERVEDEDENESEQEDSPPPPGAGTGPTDEPAANGASGTRTDPEAETSEAEGGRSAAGNATHPGYGLPGDGSGSRQPGTNRGRGRPFVSYVALRPVDHEHDSEGLDHAARMALEARAIDYIVAQEPKWQRAPALNEGFDLSEIDAAGQPSRWCEVKAMAGSLQERPVALSRAQFECARTHGADYWLYIVEHAASDAPRVIRLQDPVGKAQSFSFDAGWTAIAELEGTAD